MIKQLFNDKGLVSVALLLSALLINGCSSKTSEADTATGDQPEWDWKFYPLLDRMRIARLPCQLLPKSSITIHSPLVGVLRVYVERPETNLSSGTVWAEFEPEILVAESNALAQAEAKLEQREKLQLKLELPKEKLRVEQELEKAKRDLRMLNLLSTNREMAQYTFRYGPNPLRTNAVENARLQVALLEQTMNYLQQTNLAVMGVDLEGQRSELERRILQFERRREQARLKMPFTGQLTVNLPLTEGVTEYPVNSGQELAVARDLSVLRVRVAISDAAWVGLPPANLTAIIRMPTGEELEAPFVFKKIERVQVRDESVYYFQFPPELSDKAAKLMGTSIACELWLKLEQPARIVPKLSLLLKKSEAFQGRNWVKGIDVAWPGATLLVEGQTDLAIVLPEDRR